MQNREAVEFVFTPPKIGAGKHRNTYALINNISYWYRYRATEIKNRFKQELREWFVEQREDEPFIEADIEFTIIRNTKHRIDADSIALVSKWTVDLFVEQDWLIDDNRVRFIFHPPILGQSKEVETLIRLKATFRKEYTMTYQEFKQKLDRVNELTEELDKRWVKVKSKELRKLLTEIRHGIPSIKKDLIEIDKK